MDFLEFLIDRDFSIPTPDGIVPAIDAELHGTIRIEDTETGYATVLTSDTPIKRLRIFNYPFVQQLKADDKGHLRHFDARQTGTTTYALLYALYKTLVHNEETLYIAHDGRAARWVKDRLRNILGASNMSQGLITHVELLSATQMKDARHVHKLRMADNITFDNSMYNQVSYDGIAIHEPALKRHKDSKRIIEIITG